MADAGRIIVNRDFHGGYESMRNISQRWGYFSNWANENDVRKMENVTPELVIKYGQFLQGQIDSGKRTSASVPKNYVSAVNTVMKLATNNAWKSVRPGKDCGIQSRTYISTESKAMSEATHNAALSIVGDRIACLLVLQRAFGLRFKESCLLSPKSALPEALKHGHISLRAGTKGGRFRTVPCRPRGIPALEAAILIQDGRSMIPKGMSFKDFQDECYAVMKGIGKHGSAFHSERHAYAQERYTEITGAPAPVDAHWPRKERIMRLAEFLSITNDEAKLIDHAARLKISIELGHNRTDITNNYLG